MAYLHGIQVGAGVIDPDFRGELKVLLINNGDYGFNVWSLFFALL
jgi:dUTP pyrophosphatase